MIQCVFKSFWHQENYQKTGKHYNTITEIIESAKGLFFLYRPYPPDGASYFSANLPTDKADIHNYTKYYDIVLQPYQQQDINILEIGNPRPSTLKPTFSKPT